MFLLAWSQRARALSPPSLTSRPQTSVNRFHLIVTVSDENGVVLPAVLVTLLPAPPRAPVEATTDIAGRAEFTNLAGGAYGVRVEKVGYYAQSLDNVQVGEAESLDVTLPHQQEYKETVQVNYSPPAIDPSATTKNEGLTGQEVIDLPYLTTRDIRTALPLIPGVVPDISVAGQVHVEGSASNETLYTLDGFDISQPVTGLLDLRVSTDAVRSIVVLSSRDSAEFGWNTGGVLNVETGMGDDHFRFFASDFVPSLQEARGIHLNTVTPRFTISGPLWKGKAWFYEAVEGEYDVSISTELPPGQDTDHSWRYSNLARVQANLSASNRLTASYLVNRSNEDHAGLSIIQPLSTTTKQTKSADLVSIRDQHTWANGMLFDAGFDFLQFGANRLPFGSLPYVQLPGTASGNYYLTSSSTVRRFEGLASLFLPPFEWHGQHQISFGTDLEHTDDYQFAVRQPFTIETAAGVRLRSVSFTSRPSFDQELLAASGYVQDRWSPTRRLLIEPGVRLEGDDVLRRALVSPRLAATWMLTRDNETKISAGAGIYYDRADLDKLTRPLAGERDDIFYAADGITPLGPPVVTQFQADSHLLRAPEFLNWSVGIERKLPAAIYLKAEFIEKRSWEGFDYVDENLSIRSNGLPSSGLFVLQNGLRERYDGVTLSLRHTFQEKYPLLIAYTRSNARANAVLDSTLDNPFFSVQQGGPLAWDSPNRVVSWGALPFKLPRIHGLLFAYSLDWRTGDPYSLVNQEQELVGLPNRERFPDYFALNVHVEKRFALLGLQWALRAGFNDVTNRQNPTVINNNVDSATFGAFSGFGRRAFTGRIRFLGRK